MGQERLWLRPCCPQLHQEERGLSHLAVAAAAAAHHLWLLSLTAWWLQLLLQQAVQLRLQARLQQRQLPLRHLMWRTHMR